MRLLKPEIVKMGTKTEKGLHGDLWTQMGTGVGAVHSLPNFTAQNL